MSTLALHWSTLWGSIGIDAPAGLLDELQRRYSEAHRHYHTLQHLEECLARYDELRQAAVHAAEIEFAIWFHDAIYDVTRHDNEEQSAVLVQRALLQAGMSSQSAAHVYSLVMATRHAAQPTGADECVLVDVDLSILAASPARFAQYERQIRLEYGHVPDAVFEPKRRAILAAFLERPSVFSTALFREQYEQAARANLREAIG